MAVHHDPETSGTLSIATIDRRAASFNEELEIRRIESRTFAVKFDGEHDTAWRYYRLIIDEEARGQVPSARVPERPCPRLTIQSDGKLASSEPPASNGSGDAFRFGRRRGGDTVVLELGCTQPRFQLQIFDSGLVRVTEIDSEGAGRGFAYWRLQVAQGASVQAKSRASPVEKLLRELIPERVVSEADFDVAKDDKGNEISVPPLLANQYGANKRRVAKATARAGNKAGISAGQTVILAFFEDIPADAPDADRREYAQCNEAFFANNDNSEHINRAAGVIPWPEKDKKRGLKAIVYENTEVQYVLQTILVRKDIDVLSTLPFFTRQLLAALVTAETARGEGMIFRNLDPARTVIFSRTGDRTMAVRIMDLSSLSSAADFDACRRVLPWPTFDQYTPEGGSAGFGSTSHGRATQATDICCLGLMVAHALLASMHYGGELRWQFEGLRKQGLEALRQALKSVDVRMDNGLRRFALAALEPDPAHRPTALVALTLLHPGTPLLPISTGQLAPSALELPFAGTPDWWLETEAGVQNDSRDARQRALRLAREREAARARLPPEVFFGLRKRTK